MAFEFAFAQASSGTGDGPFVLQIDNYETLEPLDRWFRENFIPKLPGNCFVVIGGRKPPNAGWKTDPAWSDLFQPIRIENLGPEEATAYLRSRSVPEEEINEALEFTRGHPLALSLVAEVHSKPNEFGFQLSKSTDVIQALVERFMEAVPDDDHRKALEICALARVTNEALLQKALPEAEAFELFHWLKDLSFIERGPFGLFPHDLARTAIAADLKWRNPTRYSDLHMAARRYYSDALAQLSGDAQLAILFDYIYLHRENPVVAPAFQFDAETACYADSLRESFEDGTPSRGRGFGGYRGKMADGPTAECDGHTEQRFGLERAFRISAASCT